MLGDDVELNPGPKQSSINAFSVYHWNLNIMQIYFLLKPHIAIHKLDITCISETNLDSNTSPDDNNLDISGYNLKRSGYPSNNKRGGISIHHTLFILHCIYVQECINFDMKIGCKVYSFISLYRSPSQTLDDFETLSKNSESDLENIIQRNPFLAVTIGDFNAKSSKWHCQDQSTFDGIGN